MKQEIIDIEELAQDSHNFNKGNEQGQQLMERSFKELGAGRSILLDRNGNIIAGSKSQQAAIAGGNKKVRVIETTGDELVAVKRTDVDIDSAEGRKMAFLDNLTQEKNLTWDEVELQNVADEIQGFDPDEFGLNFMAEQLENEQFEEKFERTGKDSCVYPIIPKYDEKHELFIIISDNEADANYLREILNMQKMRSYKTGKLVKSNVVHIKDVINELKNRNSKSQEARQGDFEEIGE
jgi:hypothetical protein